MKRSILRLTVILAVSVVIVAGLLATASPAWANGPIEISGPSGYTRLGGSPVERQFEVPAGYSSDGLIIGRKKEGHPERGCTPALKEKQIHSSCDQLQDNEEIRVLVMGRFALSCVTRTLSMTAGLILNTPARASAPERTSCASSTPAGAPAWAPSTLKWPCASSRSRKRR